MLSRKDLQQGGKGSISYFCSTDDSACVLDGANKMDIFFLTAGVFNNIQMQWSALYLKILLHEMISKVLNFICVISYPSSAENSGGRWNST